MNVSRPCVVREQPIESHGEAGEGESNAGNLFKEIMHLAVELMHHYPEQIRLN